jgi:hypothetical protein
MWLSGTPGKVVQVLHKPSPSRYFAVAANPEVRVERMQPIAGGEVGAKGGKCVGVCYEDVVALEDRISFVSR